MKLLFSLLSTVIISFFMFNCSEDSGTNSDNNSELIMPLKTGNSWIYNDGLEVRVFSETNINNQDAFIVKLYKDTMEVQPVINKILANLSDGLYISYGGPFTIWCKYPGTTGERYGGNGGNSYWEIVSNSKTVTTQAGEFTGCYEYSYYDEGTLTETFIFKPGVGSIISDNGAELTSYSLK